MYNVKNKFPISSALAPIGAESKLIRLNMQYEKIVFLKFNDHGIPDDAKILNVSISTKDGSLLPLELPNNAANISTRHVIPNEFIFYPARFLDREPKDTEAYIFVTWVPRTPDDDSWQNLVDAFILYTQQKYDSCIIPANVAVESKLSRLLFKFLTSYAANKHIKIFLAEGATYSHQLNVILPIVSKQLDLPILPDKVRGTLNHLRKIRNDLAHYGTPREQLKHEKVAELILASLFGFSYLLLADEQLSKSE